MVLVLAGSYPSLASEVKYSWSGIITTDQTLYLSDGQLNATITVLYRPVALIEVMGTPYFLLNGTVVIGAMTVTVEPVNESSMSVLVTSEKPFSAWPVVKTETVIVNQTNETKVRELEALVEQLNATLAEKETIIANLTAELNSLRAENAKLNATVGTLLNTISVLQNQLENKTETLKTIEAEREALLKQISKLEEEKTALIAGWNAANQTLLEKEALIEQLNATLKQEQASTANLTSQIQKLEEENSQLEQKVNQLQGQVKDYPKLQAQLLNLTKKNRELKEQLANLTNRYNQLKAKADFLEQQNKEYKEIIDQAMKATSEGNKDQYIEQAKKEKMWGSILWKTLLISGIVVGLIGYGLYRAKRRHEYAGL